MNKKIKLNKNDIVMFATVGILSVVLFDFSTIQYASAFGFTSYSNSGSNTYNISNGGGYIAVVSNSAGNLKTYAQNNPSVLLGTLTCAGCTSIAYYGGNFYVSSSTTIIKVGITTSGAPVSLGTLSTTSQCQFTQYDISSTGSLICARASSSDNYSIINLGTFAITFTSSNLNSGGHPCNDPQIYFANYDENYLMATCNNNIIATYTIGTSTQLHFMTGGTNLPTIPALDQTPDRFITAVPSNKMGLYSYSTVSGFASIANTTLPGIASPTVTLGAYDSVAKRFIVNGNNNVYGLDVSNNSLLWTIGSPYSVSSASTDIRILDLVSNSLTLTYDKGADLYYFLDTTSLPAGTGGTAGQGTTTAGIDCTVPANVNLLICRLTSQTGGNIGGTGGIIGTGLTNVFVNSGIIDGSNTDVKTNGIGYIVTGVALGIMIAVFWIASKGQLREIPTFVWFIGTLSVLGSMTAIQWIDPTFLIIGVIGIVALAVAKTKSSIFGDSFGSGGFSGE